MLGGDADTYRRKLSLSATLVGRSVGISCVRAACTGLRLALHRPAQRPTPRLDGPRLLLLAAASPPLYRGDASFSVAVNGRLLNPRVPVRLHVYTTVD